MSNPAHSGHTASFVHARQMEFEDRERMAFLRKLDDADGVEVTDWEAGFIESFLRSARPFTTAQRAAVDAMRAEYEDRI